MRTAMILLSILGACAAQAQRLAPDQQPYWTRYTFVEDSSVLVPLSGVYQVYYVQEGQWWSYHSPHYPVVPKPEDVLRMRPVFDAPLPSFTATPARGKDAPDVKVVVVRGLDTMVVELSVYYTPMPAYERPTIREGERRPPVVIPFRKGRFLPTGVRYGKDYYAAEEASSTVDARTVELTKQFDALWATATKEERVIAQLNTDTCHQQVHVPADLDLPETKYRDVWVLRSPYCGRHFAQFPAWGAGTRYTVTFNPYQPEQKMDPMTIAADAGDGASPWVDMSDWPVGDHDVRLLACGNGGTFKLMLR